MFTRKTRGKVNKSLTRLTATILVDGNPVTVSRIYAGTEPKYAEFVRDINRKYKGHADVRLSGEIQTEKKLYTMTPEKFALFADFSAAE